ncbi:hypothetical protein [Iningainema tapete]|uniref:Uncharacterized protein n=1 Tax=Iningainema tapete BLCC-T55 TaxID=2748662 RepID=A0A8J6XRS5_9CYAN|nr:hypothetical protein [Iningainema tapete]MBD2772453.1 hypothetical protein [Iningainema tapete BLCC-T55]
MSNFELVIKLLLQLTVILATCRIVTIVGKRYLGQTDVVCEMIAVNECTRFDGVNYLKY